MLGGFAHTQTYDGSANSDFPTKKPSKLRLELGTHIGCNVPKRSCHLHRLTGLTLDKQLSRLHEIV